MSRKPESPLITLSPTQFTPRAEECFYSVVDSPDFSELDSQLIYRALLERLDPIPFGDYLKRYIYRAAGISQPFDTVPLTEYQDILLESFTNQDVPASFQPSTIRLRSASRNWLTQQTVRREAVLLIGFGLKMTRKDVDDLLIKGLHETGLNLRDPREYICAYCYEHSIGFHQYESLAAACKASVRDADTKADQADLSAAAAAIPAPENVRSTDELLRCAALLAKVRRIPGFRDLAVPVFMQLYRQAQETTASIFNIAEQDTAARQSEIIEKALESSDSLYDFQKQDRIQKAREPLHRWTPEEITPVHIEKVIQAAVPRDEHNNLLSARNSALNARFRGVRLTRQRMDRLLAGDMPVSRYDIIMLQFYIHSQKKHAGQSRHAYYREYVDQTNSLLARAGMGPLYTANPFESFVLMCVLSDEPLSTYSDVIEQSYKEAAHENDQ